MSSNVRIQLTKSLPEAFLSAPSVAVGGSGEEQSTPDAYGCVAEDGRPLLSIAVGSRSDECRAFEEATHDWVLLLAAGETIVVHSSNFAAHMHAVTISCA